MRTIGEILHRARTERTITLEEAEKHLRIRKKFLEALEQNAWDRLPSLPYIKGFLKNYSLYLDLKPEEMIAIFRRQYSDRESKKILPEGVVNPLNQPWFRISGKFIMIATITAFFTVMFGYLFFQYQASTNPPPLQISRPQEGETVISQSVDVEGKTEPDVVVSVNNRKIALTEVGEFRTSVSLSPGLNTVLIEATSKFGKKRTISRTILQKEASSVDETP